MKQLASRSTWWPTRPHKSTPAVNAAERAANLGLALVNRETGELLEGAVS